MPDQIDTQSLNTIMATVRIVFEDAVVLEDAQQQIIIHTGLYGVGDPSTDLVDFDTKYPHPFGTPKTGDSNGKA